MSRSEPGNKEGTGTFTGQTSDGGKTLVKDDKIPFKSQGKSTERIPFRSTNFQVGKREEGFKRKSSNPLVGYLG